MKKKTIKRKFKRVRRVLRQMLDREAIITHAVLGLLDREPDDDDSDEVEVPKLKVVGDG